MYFGFSAGRGANAHSVPVGDPSGQVAPRGADIEESMQRGLGVQWLRPKLKL